jgi:hypothetical protein
MAFANVHSHSSLAYSSRSPEVFPSDIEKHCTTLTRKNFSHFALIIPRDLLDRFTEPIGGVKLTYGSTPFSDHRETVQRLLAYLRAHGCTDIQYEFYQE